MNRRLLSGAIGATTLFTALAACGGGDDDSLPPYEILDAIMEAYV